MSKPECEEVLIQIERYLDGELEMAERVHVKEHLEGCSPCSDRASFQRHLHDLVREKCGCPEVSPELMQRIRALLRRQVP